MSEESQERIKKLFQSYRDSLPERMHELDELWGQLILSWNAEAAAEFDRVCHGLAGSALTFDCAEVGAIARQIEKLFKSQLQNSGPVPQAMIGEVRSMLSELSESISKLSV